MGLIYINGVQISFAGSWELIVWQSWVDIESNEDGRGREELREGGMTDPRIRRLQCGTTFQCFRENFSNSNTLKSNTLSQPKADF